jgi:CheY-like chemotaxis protein
MFATGSGRLWTEWMTRELPSFSSLDRPEGVCRRAREACKQAVLKRSGGALVATGRRHGAGLEQSSSLYAPEPRPWCTGIEQGRKRSCCVPTGLQLLVRDAVFAEMGTIHLGLIVALRVLAEEAVVTAMLVVEDDRLMREILGEYLRADGRFDIVLEAATGAEALIAAAQHQLAAVVLDLCLPDSRGSSLIPALRASNPSARIIVFSGDLDGRIEAESSGADGFVAKGADLAELDRILAPGSGT